MAGSLFLNNHPSMRKRFPAPKGLGSRSYASRYADGRNGRTKNGKEQRLLKKFLPSKKEIDLSGTSIKTQRSGWSLLAGIFAITLAFWVLLLIYG